MRKWNHGWAGCVVPVLLLTMLSHAAPASAQTSVEVRDLQLRHWEGSMRKVIALANAMSAEALEADTELYGRTVPGWAVLVQLETHLSEHLGQSIAYARMNGVVPPWSR